MLFRNLFYGNISDIQMCYIIIGIISFCVFLVCLIAIAILAIKKKTKKTPVIISVVMLTIYLISGTLFSLSNTGEFGYILNPDVGFEKIWDLETLVQKNKDGKNVVYDKDGKEYTYKEYKKGFIYYGIDGNIYTLVTIDDTTQTQQMICEATGKKYDIPERPLSPDDKLFYVDENGYLCLGDSVEFQEVISNEVASYYKGTDGKLYYEWTIVGWDENGDMIYFDTPVDKLSQYDSNDVIIGQGV